MAKKKRGKKHEEEASEAWLLPYSDLMTLLLALFIALFAISQTDQKKITELSQAFSSAFNMGGPSMFDKMGPNVGRRAESRLMTTREIRLIWQRIRSSKRSRKKWKIISSRMG